MLEACKGALSFCDALLFLLLDTIQKHRDRSSYSDFVVDDLPLVKMAAKSDSSTVILPCFWPLQDNFRGEAVDTAGSCRAHHLRQEAKCLARMLQTFVTLAANVPVELLRWGFYIFCPIQSILRFADFVLREMKEGFTSEISHQRKEFHSRLCVLPCSELAPRLKFMEGKDILLVLRLISQQPAECAFRHHLACAVDLRFRDLKSWRKLNELRVRFTLWHVRS